MLKKLNEFLNELVKNNKLIKGEKLVFAKQKIEDETNGRFEQFEIKKSIFKKILLNVKTKANWYVKYPNCSDGWDYDDVNVEIEVL